MANKATGDIKLNDSSRCCGLALSQEVRASHSVNFIAPSPLGHDFPRKIASVR